MFARYFVTLTLVAADRWAVLVAGSHGYENYRHQADLCHAHILLKSRGFPLSRLLSISVDDAADSSLNPFPGKLFNAPSLSGGLNVREGCELTLRGSSVSLASFKALINPTIYRIESTNLLTSSDADHVFLNFVDHGCSGRLLFPDGSLSARELVSIIWDMSSRKRFEYLLIFVEACESGSLFESYKLPEGVLAVTASNASEASWGVYCPSGEDVVSGTHLGTCLGDLFSINWMRGLGSGKSTLREFLIKVSKATVRSEVNFYGDSNLLNLAVSDFFGEEFSSVLLA